MTAPTSSALSFGFSSRQNNFRRFFLFGLAFVHGLLYMLIIPPWQAPDETAHVEHTLLMMKYGRPVTPADAETSSEIEQAIAQSLYTFRAYDYLRYPTPDPRPTELRQMPFFGSSTTLNRFSLAYVLYALVVSPFRSAEVLIQLYVLRFISVLMGAGVVVLAYETSLRIVPGCLELAVGAALLILFLPQHAFITAAVNDGNLAELLATIALYQFVVMESEGLAWQRLALGLGSAALALLTKGTALFLLPLLIGTGLVWGRTHLRQRQPHWPRKTWIALIASGVGLVAALMWWSPFQGYTQAILNGGLVNLPQAIAQRMVEDNVWESLWRLFTSFWANFGWLRVPLVDEVYAGLWVLTIVALVGLPLGGWELLARGPSRVRGFIGASAGLCLVVPILVYYAFPASAPLHQGRYLFPGLAPLAVLFMAGWLGLVRRPRAVVLILTFGLISLDAFALFSVALPYFYQ